jgi:hypothetical protein
MSSAANFDEREREELTRIPRAGRAETSTPHALTYAERQGLAMGWVGMALGVFLLLGGLALWAAWAFGAGFGAWLLAVGVMGLVMVVVVVAVNYVVMRPEL